MLSTVIVLHSYQFSRFKSFSKYKKKARVLKVFSAAKIFFCKTYTRDTQSAIRHIFEFFCLLLLAKIFAKMMGGGGDKAVAAAFCEDFCKLFKPKQKYKIEKILRTWRFFCVFWKLFPHSIETA